VYSDQDLELSDRDLFIDPAGAETQSEQPDPRPRLDPDTLDHTAISPCVRAQALTAFVSGSLFCSPDS
jgi:hypothetical protein